MHKQLFIDSFPYFNRIIDQASKVHMNLTSKQLVDQSRLLNLGKINNLGAFCVNTGYFTGRSPKDKFIVKEPITESLVDWTANNEIDEASFDQILNKIESYLIGKEIWARNAYACADPNYRIDIRIINESPWANLFCKNLFLRSEKVEEKTDDHWTIIQVPKFKADPKEDGTRQGNFTIIHFSRKTILIGGTAYTGEMKKAIFSVLNFTLPTVHNILPMHCSANEGKNKDVALYFGLSGTGKTTLSTDANRKLIGDDEHGWSDYGVFNFEGGCYAKCIHLNKDKEPEIYGAIRPGSLLENVKFFPDTNVVDFADSTLTENTRIAYPIEYIENIKTPSVGNTPNHIFFLTCDAFGILPPISKLTKAQAMYYFLSGYTAKVAGTEIGITEPQSTFSACFGKAFLPLPPVVYANLLGEKLEQSPDIYVWLVNTGWVGGAYGTGERISLSYTRRIINSALEGKLNFAQYEKLETFDLYYPTACENVPSEILNPKLTWQSQSDYKQQSAILANLFIENFKQYDSYSNSLLKAAGPTIHW